MTTNTITANINGIIFEGLTIEQAKELAGLATANAVPEDPKPRVKSAQKQEKSVARKAIDETKSKPKRKETVHYPIKANVRTMGTAAIKNAQKNFGITLALDDTNYSVTKDDVATWAWLRCTDGKLTRENGATVAAAMADGWEYSPRRNAIRRELTHDIRKGR